MRRGHYMMRWWLNMRRRRWRILLFRRLDRCFHWTRRGNMSLWFLFLFILLWRRYSFVVVGWRWRWVIQILFDYWRWLIEVLSSVCLSIFIWRKASRIDTFRLLFFLDGRIIRLKRWLLNFRFFFTKYFSFLLSILIRFDSFLLHFFGLHNRQDDRLIADTLSILF